MTGDKSAKSATFLTEFPLFHGRIYSAVNLASNVDISV